MEHDQTTLKLNDIRLDPGLNLDIFLFSRDSVIKWDSLYYLMQKRTWDILFKNTKNVYLLKQTTAEIYENGHPEQAHHVRQIYQ